MISTCRSSLRCENFGSPEHRSSSSCNTGVRDLLSVIPYVRIGGGGEIRNVRAEICWIGTAPKALWMYLDMPFMEKWI